MEKSKPRPPAKPEDAGDDWEAPEPEEGAFVLHGRKKLMVISLEVDDGVAAKRETMEKRGDEPEPEPEKPAEPEGEKPEGEEGEEGPPAETFELSEATAAAIASGFGRELRLLKEMHLDAEGSAAPRASDEVKADMNTSLFVTTSLTAPSRPCAAKRSSTLARWS